MPPCRRPSASSAKRISATCSSSCRANATSARRATNSKAVSGEAEVIPLFGRLSSGDQQRVFASSPRRKIVIATNIAETSLTIPGIRYVIDAGSRASAATTRALAPGACPWKPFRRAAPTSAKAAPACRSRRLHPVVFRGGFQRPPAVHPAGDPARQSRGSHPAHEGVQSRRHRDLSVRPAAHARLHRPRLRAAQELGALDDSANSLRSAATWRDCPSTRRLAGCCSSRSASTPRANCSSSPPA
jgi:HrpA-like helicases